MINNIKKQKFQKTLEVLYPFNKVDFIFLLGLLAGNT